MLKSRGIGNVAQSDLRAVIEDTTGTADIRDLVPQLNKVDPAGFWQGAPVPDTALDALKRRVPWLAELKEFPNIGHAVIVDGVDGAGQLLIRDPFDATSSTMSRDDFLGAWTTRAAFRN